MLDVRTSPLPASELRAVAVASELDPRTVRRALTGRPVHSASLARLTRVLRRRGQLGLLPRAEIELAHKELRVAAAESRAIARLERALAAALEAAAPVAKEK